MEDIEDNYNTTDNNTDHKLFDDDTHIQKHHKHEQIYINTTTHVEMQDNTVDVFEDNADVIEKREQGDALLHQDHNLLDNNTLEYHDDNHQDDTVYHTEHHSYYPHKEVQVGEENQLLGIKKSTLQENIVKIADNFTTIFSQANHSSIRWKEDIAEVNRSLAAIKENNNHINAGVEAMEISEQKVDLSWPVHINRFADGEVREVGVVEMVSIPTKAMM